MSDIFSNLIKIVKHVINNSVGQNRRYFQEKFLLETLKYLGIQFKTSGKRQTLEQYNNELEKNDAEIENGVFITMEDLIKDMEQW